MAKKTARRVWMRVLSKDDAAELSKLLAGRQPEWSEWECKVHRSNILVYVPITPWDPETGEPDPSIRYMDRHWRVAPEPGGSFRLEYMRHTGQWWPVFDAVGDLKKIAGHIARQAEASSYLTNTASKQSNGGQEQKMPVAKKKAKKKPAARKNKAATAPSPLREIVGQEVYDVWVTMLKELVPDGRTHRISVLVASMLAYASSIAWSTRDTDDEDDLAYPLLVASEGMDDEETLRLLGPMLTRLFGDAKVKYERTSSRGEQYSVLWEAVIEFNRWHNYPWEG